MKMISGYNVDQFRAVAQKVRDLGDRLGADKSQIDLSQEIWAVGVAMDDFISRYESVIIANLDLIRENDDLKKKLKEKGA